MESQLNGHMTKQVQPVHEKANLDTRYDASGPEDEGLAFVYNFANASDHFIMIFFEIVLLLLLAY